MKSYLLPLMLLASTISYQTSAQAPFNTIEYIDVNNIKAAVAVHGDLFWDPAAQSAACEFPKGSGMHANFMAALWMGGYDQQTQLNVSAQDFRMSGNDFWPGPIVGSSQVSYSTSQDWAKVWKINKSDITTFLSSSKHTIASTPVSILEWPAKGNPYAKGNNGVALAITTPMAPFVDVNKDGSYDPLAGDYPDMRGDQMLWWVFSDFGPTHDNNLTPSMQMEIRAMAYAYNRGTSVDNIIFYEMDITNKNPLSYSGFVIGLRDDIDLGYFNDDYIGFDSTRRLGYAYNAKTVDGSGQPGSYGSAPPISGITFLQVPEDAPSAKIPVGSFMRFYNDPTVYGNPTSGADRYNYMTARYRDGSHLKNDFVGPGTISKGYGSGPDVNYIFTGNPAVSTEWSECSAQNPSGDTRFVMASQPATFTTNTVQKFAFALLITDTGRNNACGNITTTSITGIKDLADTAWVYYGNPKFPSSVSSISNTNDVLQVYPNPAKDKLTVSANAAADMNSIVVYNVLGEKMSITHRVIGDQAEVDVASLPSGVYLLQLNHGNEKMISWFIKE